MRTVTRPLTYNVAALGVFYSIPVVLSFHLGGPLVATASSFKIKPGSSNLLYTPELRHLKVNIFHCNMAHSCPQQQGEAVEAIAFSVEASMRPPERSTREKSSGSTQHPTRSCARLFRLLSELKSCGENQDIGFLHCIGSSI
jgi:hypothetical protein